MWRRRRGQVVPVHVAGSAVEIAQLGWPRCHRGFREDEHGDGEHLPLSCGYEHRVSVQRGPAVLGGAARGLGCRRSALAWWCAKALPVPHGTDTSSATESGQGVRVLPGGVQRRAPRARRDLSGWGETGG